MTYSPQPKPQPDPARVAAATAMANAFGPEKFVDPSVRALSEDWLRGDATFFGLPMHGSEKAHRAIYSMLTGLGIDVDHMERHYYTLLGD